MNDRAAVAAWREAVKAVAEQEKRDRERWAWGSPQRESSRKVIK